MPTLFPGVLMTVTEPYLTVQTMWRAFDVLATNKWPAIHGERFFAHSNGETTSYSSIPSPAQLQRSRSSHNHAQGSVLNPLDMNITRDAFDPFCNDAVDWPLQFPSEVYAVTQTLSTSDPTLLSPLLTNSARSQALSAHGGRCLNFGGTDHSMLTCRQEFTNAFGILKPMLGQLNDGGYVYRQWQQRMRSYRRGHYDKHVERSSNRNTNNGGYRNNNGHSNHGNNNQGNNSHSNHGRNRRQYGNNGRSYNNGNNQLQGQQFQQRRIEAALSAATPSTAPTVQTPASNTPAAAPPETLRLGPNYTPNSNNQRQPGTFREN